MKKVLMLIVMVSMPLQFSFAQDEMRGVRGDPEAIAEAEAMVETMGGMEIWAQLKSVHFVHEWFPWYRVDSYIENEILDLTGPSDHVVLGFEGTTAQDPEYFHDFFLGFIRTFPGNRPHDLQVLLEHGLGPVG